MTTYQTRPAPSTPSAVSGDDISARVDVAVSAARKRVRISRVCHDCGSIDRETAFPGTHKPYRQRDRCTDCAAEHARRAEVSPATARLVASSIQTRASYRAAQPQGDLVDLLVAAP